MKRSIYAERRKKFPTLPKSLQDVHDSLDNLKSTIVTNRQEEFLLVNDRNMNIIIFSCETNLRHLCKCSKIFMDGTFKYCPKYFLQVFTIHGFCNGHYTPLVFCLLKNKASDTYQNCFNLLISKCADLCLQLQPSEIVIDFEKAIHIAVNTVWERTKIVGCRFHISQAWWRKIQELGLAKEYKERTEVGKWVGYCFGLLFLGESCVAFVFICVILFS